MTQKELEREIMRTIEDMYRAEDDADIYLDQELRQLEDGYAAGNIEQDDYEEQEGKLVSEQNNCRNEAQYLYAMLGGDLFPRYEEMTGQKVNVEYFTEGGIFS